MLRIAETVELAAILGDYLQENMLREEDVNSILEEHGCGFSFRESYEYDDASHIKLKVAPLDSIPGADLAPEHPNIRKLASRMDSALSNKDFSGVLHSSACIFETVAKDVMDNPHVDNQTLASFFDGYRKKSKLPAPILDYILQVYKNRNTEPLAGHGSVIPPTLGEDEAITLAEMTKAIVRIERKLGEQSLGREDIKSISPKVPSSAGSKKQKPSGKTTKK